MSCIDVVENEVAEFLEKKDLYLPQGSIDQTTCTTEYRKTREVNLEKLKRLR